jgi:hypothetical protein
VLPVEPQLDTRGDSSSRQELLTFTAESSDPYYLIVQSRKGIGGISFLAQDGGSGGAGDATGLVQTAPPPQRWLLWVAGAAIGVALVALGMAARAWRRRVTSDE